MKTRKGFKCESCNTKDNMTHDEAMEHLGHDYKEPQHTPTPWNLIGGMIGEGSQIIAHNAQHQGVKVAINVKHEDAAFIVRAVNNFDALLIEIQYLHELAKQLKDYNPEWREKVEKLIAKAEGKHKGKCEYTEEQI